MSNSIFENQSRCSLNDKAYRQKINTASELPSLECSMIFVRMQASVVIEIRGETLSCGLLRFTMKNITPTFKLAVRPASRLMCMYLAMRISKGSINKESNRTKCLEPPTAR